MPRRPKPWFKASHKAWYAKIDGKPIRLGETEREALKAFHRLMAKRGAGSSGERLTVVELLDRWLSDREASVKPTTLETYVRHCQWFADWIGKGRLAEELRAKDVLSYLESKGWESQGTRRQATIILRTAYLWGENQGWIERSPLRGLKAPMMPSRAGVDPEELSRFLDVLRPDARDLVEFMVSTGTRPGEARTLEASRVDLKASTAVVLGKVGPRVVVLPRSVLPTLRRLIKAHPSGPIFRNSRGNPWQMKGIEEYVRRTRRRHGFSEDLVPYSSRGAFATKAIGEGVDISTVANLLGHRSLAMLHRHYHKPVDKSLREAVEKAQTQRKKKPRG